MRRVEALLAYLDAYNREPRLIDVACGGPRGSLAVRLLDDAPLDATVVADHLARRLPDWEPDGGRWLPVGEHAQEVFELLIGLDHDGAQPSERPAVAGPTPREETPIPVAAGVVGQASLEPEPAEATNSSWADAGATTAQIQSLAEELDALRASLAAAKEAEFDAAAARDALSREVETLRAKREDLLAQLAKVKQRRRDLEAELAELRDALTEAQARSEAVAASDFNAARLDHIAWAASGIADQESVSADDLRLVEHLRAAVPEDPRVAQSLGILMSRLGQHSLATETLASVPPDRLSRAGALALLHSSIAHGTLPNGARALVARLRPSARELSALADLTESLSSRRVAQLTDELLTVVPDEDMAAWFTIVTPRLIGRPLVSVLERWAAIEPDRTLHALTDAIEAERLSTNNSEAASLALGLDWSPLDDRRARELAQRLAKSVSRARDVGGLYRLLRQTDDLALDDRHRIGIELVHAIAEIVPERDDITQALDAAVRYVEDHRQANRLTDAARLAGFVRQNIHRADEDTQALAQLVLADLERALVNTAIGQRVAEELEREALVDIKRRVAGRRFLFVGGQRQDWYDALRLEIGLSGDSEWRESSRAEPPSMHQLKAIVKAGKLDGVVVYTDFVAHKTSAIKETAQQYDVPYMEAKMSKQGLIDAMREWMRIVAAEQM